jgi:hypothetical protein
MPRSNLSTLCNARFPARPLAFVAVACLAHGVSLAAALPIPPLTFDTTYAAPTGTTINVSAGGDLQAALNKAQLGDTIVLQAGATFTGPFTLPNKTSGSGWIYVVSGNLASLPAPGNRVGPDNAVNMPKIVAPGYGFAIQTVKGSHHFRFAGIEFTPVSGAYVYQVVTIGNTDTSPATLANHIVFDRCYVHPAAGQNARRGIEIDGAYVAVVDSYVAGFKDTSDSQALWAYNTTGPLKIVDNYLEAAGENILFGGADSKAASLLPADIQISNNYFFKPLSLMSTPTISTKNLLEFKAATRVVANGNTLENNPVASQDGFALLVTPRNQDGTAPWSMTSDIAITNNVFINVASGINLLGMDNHYPNPSLMTTRLLIRNNVISVTGLGGGGGRGFDVSGGGSNYTIDHNTIIDATAPPVSTGSELSMAESTPKVSNFAFTNNLATQTAYGFFGSGVGEGTAALNGNFTSWTFAKNVIVNAKATIYPAGNFFPASLAAVQFANYLSGDYSLAAGSPYKSAGTDGLDIGANLSATSLIPTPPPSFSVK